MAASAAVERTWNDQRKKLSPAHTDAYRRLVADGRRASKKLPGTRDTAVAQTQIWSRAVLLRIDLSLMTSESELR